MNFKTKVHIAVQIAALAAQSLIPSLPLSPAMRAWIVPIISFVQGVLAIIALFTEAPTNGGDSSGSKQPPLTGAVGLIVLAGLYGAVSGLLAGVLS